MDLQKLIMLGVNALIGADIELSTIIINMISVSLMEKSYSKEGSIW